MVREFVGDIEVTNKTLVSVENERVSSTLDMKLSAESGSDRMPSMKFQRRSGFAHHSIDLCYSLSTYDLPQERTSYAALSWRTEICVRKEAQQSILPTTALNDTHTQQASTTTPAPRGGDDNKASDYD